MRKIICLILIMLSLQVTAINAEGAKKSINIAVLPCTDIVMTFKKFHPLVTYLTQKTGLSVRLVVPENLTRFETSLNNGEIDFALQDPHTFLKLAHLFDKESLIGVLNIEGGTTQSGVVVVRKDSAIKQITDLKGKTVMFGPKFSASKWLAAKLLFEDNRINIEKDLRAYFNGGCCEDIAFSVYLKAVDAGVVCKHFLGEHEEKQKDLGIDATKIVIIGQTKAVPMKVLSARKGTSKDTISKINQALLALDRKNPEHVKILFSAEIGGFNKNLDGDFPSIKIMMSDKRVK
jgi:phosphonate transport system substrate-binding protein